MGSFTNNSWPIHGQYMANSWPAHGQFMSSFTSNAWPVHGQLMASSWRVHEQFVTSASDILIASRAIAIADSNRSARDLYGIRMNIQDIQSLTIAIAQLQSRDCRLQPRDGRHL
eukprot:4135982-Lingulodinium_polyedra.AAC.1